MCRVSFSTPFVPFSTHFSFHTGNTGFRRKYDLVTLLTCKFGVFGFEWADIKCVGCSALIFHLHSTVSHFNSTKMNNFSRGREEMKLQTTKHTEYAHSSNDVTMNDDGNDPIAVVSFISSSISNDSNSKLKVRSQCRSTINFSFTLTTNIFGTNFTFRNYLNRTLSKTEGPGSLHFNSSPHPPTMKIINELNMIIIWRRSRRHHRHPLTASMPTKRSNENNNKNPINKIWENRSIHICFGPQKKEI